MNTAIHHILHQVLADILSTSYINIPNVYVAPGPLQILILK